MRHPAVPLFLAILAGSAAGLFVEAPLDLLAGVVWLAGVLAGACLANGEPRAFVAAALTGFLVCGWALAVAATQQALMPPLRQVLVRTLGPDAVSDKAADPVHLTAVLAEDAAPDEDGVRLAVEALAVETRGARWPASGGVLVSVAGDPREARVDDWRKGRVIRAPVLVRRPSRYLNPGVPDHELGLLRRGVALVGTVKSSRLIDVIRKGSPLDERAAAARAAARRVLDRDVGRHSPQSAAIARAIVIGDRSGLDDDIEERLQAAGTYHVLAISGGNIAILAAVVLGLLRLAAVRSPVAECAAIVVLLTYAWGVGGGASVSRATLMAVTMLAARAVDHRSKPANAVAVSGGVGLSVSPLGLYDPGAWLTYGATSAIILAAAEGGSWLQRQRAWLRAPAALLAASAAAELALFPISAFVFSRVTVAGLVANFAAIPLMTVVQVGAMTTLAASVVSPQLSAPAGFVTHLAALGLVESGRLVDVAPWLASRIPPPSEWVVGVYYASWGAGLWAAWLLRGSVPSVAAWLASRRRHRWRTRLRLLRAGAAVAGVGAAAWILAAPVPPWSRPKGAVRVTFLDVGQGDSTLIQTPDGHTVLVDAGGAGGGRFDIGGRVVAPALWELGVRRLTALVVTHGDADHMNGAESVVRDFRPREVWEGVPVASHPPLGALRSAARRAGAAWRSVQRGDRLALGDVEVLVLHPPAWDWERQRVRNDDSVALEVRCGDVSLVLPGDAEAGAEMALREHLAPGPLRVLQAPHHGSASSSSEALLAAARPRVGIVSAGRGNRYGHPHGVVLDRFRRAGSRVFRTDRDGAIVVTTDGHDLRIETFTGRTAEFRRPVRTAAR